MPGWRRFIEENDDSGFEILLIALDHEGPEASRPYAETAGPAIRTVVDSRGLLSNHFGFQVVPNGYLVDENGLLQFAKHGFSVDSAEDLETVARFRATGETPVSSRADPGYEVDPASTRIIEHLLDQSRLERERGDFSEAARLMRVALRRDPANYTIRKQIWALEHPEKFHPVIDFAWQKEQLLRERNEETDAGWFDKDGSFVPV